MAYEHFSKRAMDLLAKYPAIFTGQSILLDAAAIHLATPGPEKHNAISRALAHRIVELGDDPTSAETFLEDCDAAGDYVRGLAMISTEARG